MIAIYDGNELKFIECTDVWNAAKTALNQATIEPLPRSYTRINSVFTKLNDAGICLLIDESGRLKKLPISLSCDQFEIFGTVVFVGNGSEEFKPLTIKQIGLIKDCVLELMA